MNELHLYEEAYKKEMINKIKDLELPPEWRPYEVIRYIVRILDGGINGQQ